SLSMPSEMTPTTTPVPSRPWVRSTSARLAASPCVVTEPTRGTARSTLRIARTHEKPASVSRAPASTRACTRPRAIWMRSIFTPACCSFRSSVEPSGEQSRYTCRRPSAARGGGAATSPPVALAVGGGRSRELIFPCLAFEARAARRSYSWPSRRSSGAGCAADGTAEATVAHRRAIERMVLIVVSLRATGIAGCVCATCRGEAVAGLERRDRDESGSAAIRTTAAATHVRRSDARRGPTGAVVAGERVAIADHRLTQDRGPPDAVGELAPELREQAVGVGHGRPDAR